MSQTQKLVLIEAQIIPVARQGLYPQFYAEVWAQYAPGLRTLIDVSKPFTTLGGADNAAEQIMKRARATLRRIASRRGKDEMTTKGQSLFTNQFRSRSK